MLNEEPKLIKEFRELYDYVRLMGEHINQIHNRLENIEKNIKDFRYVTRLPDGRQG